MHQRAVSLLVTKASAAASQTTFSLALQAAASRAWSRQASTYIPITSGVKANILNSKTHPSPNASQRNSSDPTPDRSLGRKKLSPSIQYSPRKQDPRHISPDLTNKASTPFAMDACNEFRSIKERPLSSSLEDKSSISETTSQLSHHPCPEAEFSLAKQTSVPKRPPRLGLPSRLRVFRPSTSHAFGQNLVRLIYFSKPPLPLPAIIDYHNLHPELHSTRSYNTLLALTLQHIAFATFRSLIDSMRASRIGRNLETWKLEIRYLVKTGSWDQAWARVDEPFGRGHSQVRQQSIPTPIWLEFFSFPRNGPRKSSFMNEESQQETKGGHRALRNIPQNREVDPSLWDHRLKLLFDRAPKDMSDLPRVQPHVIRGVVSFLLRLQHREHALLVTKSYFRTLPWKLSAQQARACTDIINLHVAFGSPEKGLHKLSNTKKLLSSLFRLHPCVRPDASTLFLLLSPLKHAKRCGSTAKYVTGTFVTEWGTEVLDDRVRRRIVSLALKEGRSDIVEEYLKSDNQPSSPARGSAESGTRILPRRAAVRLPRRILFSESGRERQLWHRLRRRTL